MSGLITYDNTIPNPDNDPSFDVFTMNTNSDAIQDIWTTDHTTFNTNFSGTHSKVTYLDKISSPALPGASGTPSIAYTGAGVADATTAQNYFKNAQGTFPLNSIRAFASFLTVTANPVTPTLKYNVVSVTWSNLSPTFDLYTVALEPNCTIGTNYIVFPIANTIANPIYVFTQSANSFILGVKIGTGFAVTGTEIKFAVVQI